MNLTNLLARFLVIVIVGEISSPSRNINKRSLCIFIAFPPTTTEQRAFCSRFRTKRAWKELEASLTSKAASSKTQQKYILIKWIKNKMVMIPSMWCYFWSVSLPLEQSLELLLVLEHERALSEPLRGLHHFVVFVVRPVVLEIPLHLLLLPLLNFFDLFNSRASARVAVVPHQVQAVVSLRDCVPDYLFLF